jgi:hypothetical protein
VAWCVLLIGVPAESTTSGVNFETGVGLGNCINVNASPTQTCTTSSGIEIRAIGGGNLFIDEFRGVTGLGITGGIDGEVDEAEVLSIRFPHAVDLASIEFSRLFGPNSGDEEFESAEVLTNFSEINGVLTVDPGEMTATWLWNDLFGAQRTELATTLDPSIRPGGGFGAGYYRVESLVGLGLSAFENTGNPDFTNDFALVGIAVVPEPSTLFLLTTGLLALLYCDWRRRKQRA